MIEKLKLLGYWNDGVFQSHYMFPQELVGERPSDPTLKANLAKYLSSAHKVCHYKGYSSCRICGKTLGTTDVTDGTWIWPEKMEHYVLEHDLVNVPQEFIEHAESNNWSIEPVAQECLEVLEQRICDSKVKIDRDFWVQWCYVHRDMSKSPWANIKVSEVPTKTGPGEISLNIINRLFATVEQLDCFVCGIAFNDFSRLGIDNKDKWDLCDGIHHLWTADLFKSKFPILYVWSHSLIDAGRDDTPVIACLAFVNGKPHYYINSDNSYIGSVISEGFDKESIYHVINTPLKIAEEINTFMPRKALESAIAISNQEYEKVYEIMGT